MRRPAYKFTLTFERGNGRTSKRSAVPLTAAQCDLVAMVAIDLRRVIFVPISKISKRDFQIGVGEFVIEEIERISWLQSLDCLVKS